MSDSQILKKANANGKPLRRRLIVLTRRSDFLRTFRSGRKIRPCDWMIFNYASSTEDRFRAGWTCPKAVGTAPLRNRMKRWTREWLRAQLKMNENAPAIDLNVGFRAMPGDFYRRLKRPEFDEAMKRGWAQLLKHVSRAEKSPAL